MELRVICKYVYFAVCNCLCDVVYIDYEEEWAQHSALGDTTSDSCRARVDSVDHNMLGSLQQEALNPLQQFAADSNVGQC